MQFGYNLSLGFKRESTKMFGFFFHKLHMFIHLDLVLVFMALSRIFHLYRVDR